MGQGVHGPGSRTGMGMGEGGAAVRAVHGGFQALLARQVADVRHRIHDHRAQRFATHPGADQRGRALGEPGGFGGEVVDQQFRWQRGPVTGRRQHRGAGDPAGRQAHGAVGRTDRRFGDHVPGRQIREPGRPGAAVTERARRRWLRARGNRRGLGQRQHDAGLGMREIHLHTTGFVITGDTCAQTGEAQVTQWRLCGLLGPQDWDGIASARALAGNEFRDQGRGVQGIVAGAAITVGGELIEQIGQGVVRPARARGVHGALGRGEHAGQLRTGVCDTVVQEIGQRGENRGGGGDRGRIVGGVADGDLEPHRVRVETVGDLTGPHRLGDGLGARALGGIHAGVAEIARHQETHCHRRQFDGGHRILGARAHHGGPESIAARLAGGGHGTGAEQLAQLVVGENARRPK